MSRPIRALLLLTMAAVLPVQAAGAATAVSPGTLGEEVGSAASCPTFAWASHPSATGFEVQVFSTSMATSDGPVLSERLPAGATAWTPPLERCLERGHQYAWTVRALGESKEAWAEPLIFRVPQGPSPAELERTLAVLRAWRDELGSSLEPRADLSLEATASARKRAAGGEAYGGREQYEQRGSERVEATGENNAPLIPVYSLSVGNDLGLEGAIFKDGLPFLHNTGGDLLGNTGLGYAALSQVEGTSDNTGVGSLALEKNTIGAGNTAVGSQALNSNLTGDNNTALGARTLRKSTIGSQNVAVGDAAMSENVGGSFNSALGRASLASLGQNDAPSSSMNVAFGFLALSALQVGSANTALGSLALSSLDDENANSGNIAVGSSAGTMLSTGSDNIYIGHPGKTLESDTVRIGDPAVHQETFLAGSVVIGSEESASAQLEVERSLDGSVNGLGNYVALVENPSTVDSRGSQVLALKVGIDAPQSTSHFISFWDDDSVIGSVKGSGGGGVVFETSSADFAEYLPKADPSEVLSPGDVVGVFGSRVGLRTSGADRILVVTTSPAIVGANPGPDREALYERVAFLGQVPVRVEGHVTEGDFLVASGRQDGMALAVSEADLSIDQFAQVIGRAIGAKTSSAPGAVPALVGLPGPSAAAEARELEALRSELERVRERLAELEGNAL